MKKLIFLLIICLFSCQFNYSEAQNIDFKLRNFKEDKKNYKKAKKNFNEGKRLFDLGKSSYVDAIMFFTLANHYNPNNAELNYKLGKAYLKAFNSEKSIAFFNKSYLLDSTYSNDIVYMLAQAYHQTHEFDKAIEYYTKYKAGLSPRQMRSIGSEIDLKIRQSENGKKLVLSPERVFIDNLGKAINTKYPEYSPVITANGKIIYFTSRRHKTFGGKLLKSDGLYYEDVYMSEKKNGEWQAAKQLKKPINTSAMDASLSLSANENILFIYRSSGKGDIYASFKKAGKWKSPSSMGKNINSSKSQETSASLSPDGSKLYFVSDRSGGFGGKDIYVVSANKRGRWGKAELLPASINTPYDEEGVFAHPDGKTLYFSSKGHNSMGGFDIFRSTFDGTTWSQAENIGYPVNTADDDLFISISTDGRFGYYSTVRPDGFGLHDIYEITFLGPEKPMLINSEDNLIAWKSETFSKAEIEPQLDINTSNIILVKGLILDEKDRKPLLADIRLYDLEKNEELAVFNSNPNTGSYLLSLPSGVNYGIAVNVEGYLFHSENFDIPSSPFYKEIIKEIFMKKIEVGSSIILKNIFFDFDKASLKPESTTELDRLVSLLNEIPNLKIEISGHTDNIGSAQYNKSLSERRAKAVVDYLIDKGINTTRLTFKGSGFDSPIAPNDTEEGRQQNRRTEFKVISN